MPDTKISLLTPAPALVGSEQIPLLHSVGTRRATAMNLAGLSRHPGMISGRPYGLYDGAVATGAIPAIDTIYFVPIFLPFPLTVTNLSLRATSGGALSSVKIGLWANVGGRPGGLNIMGNDTPIDTTTSGMKTVTQTVTLPAGWYWFGTKVTGTPPTVMGVGATTGRQSFLLGGATLTSASQGSATAQLTGISCPDAFANNITSKDMSLVSVSAFGEVVTTGVPIPYVTIA